MKKRPRTNYSARHRTLIWERSRKGETLHQIATLVERKSRYVMDLAGYSQAKLNALARRLNERPRKTLQYETPAQPFNEAVAATS